MFGSRRHRPPNPPLTSATANPNAASAAATAFMSASNHKPSRSLSSAAAAAALRARPHTPTNVGEVQTKRTIRRSASVSSAGSVGLAAARPQPTAQLRRQSSSGSMAERTFRSPSPHRASSIQATDEQPPVPQIPTGHKKSASTASPAMGMQVFRTASQKVKAGHPSWYTEPTGDPSNVRTSDLPMKTTKPQLQKPPSIITTQRPDSRSSSVNFSYPTAFRAQSPPASPTSSLAPQFSSPPAQRPASPPRSNRASMSSVGSGKTEQPMVYDPNSRRMIPKAAADNVEYYSKEAADKQPKQRKYGGPQKEGSHLAKGTVARVKGTAVDANTGERELPKREQPVLEATPTIEESRILEEPMVKAIITTSGKPGRYQGGSEGDQSSQTQDLPKSRSRGQTQSQYTSYPTSTDSPTSPVAREKPSVEQKEPEEVAEQADDVVQPSRKIIDALDAVPTRQSIFEQPENPQLSSQEASEAIRQQQADNKSTEQAESPMETLAEKKTAFIENKPVVELSREGSSVRRSNSNSPARQAHFLATPSDNLAVRHTPLPRSASPIKSALKRTSPTPREVSPSDKSSDMSGSRGASPHQREEGSATRKKSVRVSFDDRTMATVVGESAPAGDTDEPILPSPQQAKRHWYSNIGRSKRREFTLDDEEIMKPRPALPSFGSVREKKARELGERPLVRPHEPTHSPVIPSSPELHPSNPPLPAGAGTPDELSLGQSSDQAIGSILAQAQTSRNAPNISRFREPLPPVVTSVEGSGYISDSIGSSDSDDDLLNSVADASDTEDLPNTQITQPDTEHNSQNNSTVLEEHKPTDLEVVAPETINPAQEIPEISVIQPSPRVLEQSTPATNVSVERIFDIPGSFPDNESDSTRDSQNTAKETENKPTSSPPPSAPPVFEPKAAVHPIQPETLPQTTLATTTPLDAAEDEPTDDSASVYSDAYEDLTDTEGDGFLSLNAVVEKPIDKITPSQLPELPGDVPKNANAPSQPQVNEQPPATVKSPEPPQDKDDWEKAKAFWRSLTAEKRRQLELEAMEEAGIQGDGEEVTHPVTRSSDRKKAAHQRQTTAKVKPQLSTAPTEPIILASPERVHVVQPGSQASHESVSPPPTSSRMRKSLRAEKPGHADGMRKTLRSQSGTGQMDQLSARRSAQREAPTPIPSKSSQAQKTITPAQTVPTDRPRTAVPSDKPPLQRRGSDASDSSFKRNRPTQRGGFLRNSMRPLSSSQSHDATKGSGRFSLRSLSPAGSAFRHSLTSNPVDATPPPAMRHTLRSGSVSSQERILPSIHFPSFGRSRKASSTKRSKRLSRFGDSDDEDEGGLPNFHSRFDDSSDEDSIRPTSSSQASPLSRGTLRASTAGTTGFRRATPVPEVDEDSPELPESDGEMPSPLQSPRARLPAGNTGLPRSNSEALGTATLTRSRSGRGGFSTSVSMPDIPHRERRSSLMGILRRNKRADPAGKIQRPGPMESAARRDTKLERSSEQLRDLRGDRPSSPRLQKRASVRRNDSWPLGDPAEGESVKRPNSAGNLLDQGSTGSAIQRLGMNGRRSTSLGLPAAYDDDRDNVTVDGLSHRKKKKFGALRRMFGLDD